MKIVKSTDPYWKKWGLVRKGRQTLWFDSKKEVENYVLCLKVSNDEFVIP